jgi:hypothetical protein
VRVAAEQVRRRSGAKVVTRAFVVVRRGAHNIGDFERILAVTNRLVASEAGL